LQGGGDEQEDGLQERDRDRRSNSRDDEVRIRDEGDGEEPPGDQRTRRDQMKPWADAAGTRESLPSFFVLAVLRFFPSRPTSFASCFSSHASPLLYFASHASRIFFRILRITFPPTNVPYSLLPFVFLLVGACGCGGIDGSSDSKRLALNWAPCTPHPPPLHHPCSLHLSFSPFTYVLPAEGLRHPPSPPEET
jgi:hypothetical protein